MKTYGGLLLEEGGIVEGFYNPADGSIHILADRMKSQTDVQRVLRHEGMHWAFANVLKKEYQELLAGSIAKISGRSSRRVAGQVPECFGYHDC